MLSQRWDRQRVIWWSAILAFEVLICLYFMFFIGKVKAAKEVTLTTAQQELSTLRNDAGQLSEMQKELKEALVTVSHLEPGLPTEKMGTYYPTMLSQLQTLAVSHRLKLEVIMPGATKVATNPTPPAAPSGTPGGTPPANGPASSVAGGTPGAPGAAPVPAPAPDSQEATSSITLTGRFNDLMAFINSLKKFPKVIKIDSLQLRPKEMDSAGGASPELGVTMQITGTILPYLPEVDSESQAHPSQN